MHDITGIGQIKGDKKAKTIKTVDGDEEIVEVQTVSIKGFIKGGLEYSLSIKGDPADIYNQMGNFFVKSEVRMNLTEANLSLSKFATKEQTQNEVDNLIEKMETEIEKKKEGHKEKEVKKGKKQSKKDEETSILD